MKRLCESCSLASAVHCSASVSSLAQLAPGTAASSSSPVTTTSTAALINSNKNNALFTSRRFFRKDLFEGPLDLKPGEKARKGPPVAHSLPVYKTTHKLHNSVRWKNANLVTNVAGGRDYRLRETQGEGTFDETGMYRDWLYGDERRYANYVATLLGAVAIGLFFYTMRVMGTETWDIPTPVLAAQRKKVAREHAAVDEQEALAAGAAPAALDEATQRKDALAMLKRPATLSKAS